MHPDRARRKAGEADPLGDRSPDSHALNQAAEPARGALEQLKDLFRGVPTERAGALGDDAVSKGLGSIWDALSPSLGEALTDIRKKLIEEPWFGRETTDRELSVTHHGAPEVTQAAPLSFADLMRAQAAMLPKTPEHEAPDQTRNGPDL